MSAEIVAFAVIDEAEFLREAERLGAIGEPIVERMARLSDAYVERLEKLNGPLPEHARLVIQCNAADARYLQWCADTYGEPSEHRQAHRARERWLARCREFGVDGGEL